MSQHRASSGGIATEAVAFDRRPARRTKSVSATVALPALLSVLTIANLISPGLWAPSREVDLLGQFVPITTALVIPLIGFDIFTTLVPSFRARARNRAVAGETKIWAALLFFQLISSLLFGFTFVGFAYFAGGTFFVVWFRLIAAIDGAALVNVWGVRLWVIFLATLAGAGTITGKGLLALPDNINLVAMLVLYGCAVVVYGVSRGMVSWPAALTLPVMTLLLLVDQRRTAAVSLLLFAVVIWIGRYLIGAGSISGWRSGKFSPALGVGLVVSIAVMALSSTVRNQLNGFVEYALRSTEIFDATRRISTDNRRAQLFAQGWAVAADSLPFGVGHGHFLEAVREQFPSGDFARPHNFVLISTAELGVAGLLASFGAIFGPIVLLRPFKRVYLSVAVALLPIPFMLTNDYILSAGYWLPTAFAFQLASRQRDLPFRKSRSQQGPGPTRQRLSIK